MTHMIVADECINCCACESVCPNDAIYEIEEGPFTIIEVKCTDCEDFHEEPQCVSICPIDDVCVLVEEVEVC